MADACPECGGGTIVLADATVQCISCGRSLGNPATAAETQPGVDGGTPLGPQAPDWQEASSLDPAGQFDEEHLQPADDSDWLAIFLDSRLRMHRLRRDLIKAGGVIVLLGSFVMLLSPFVALGMAKILLEAEVEHAVGWAWILHIVLGSGPGMLICFGMFVSVTFSLYGVYMGMMMTRGAIDSRAEIFLSTIAMGVMGSAISLLTIGGLLGVAGAGLIVIGGLVSVLPV